MGYFTWTWANRPVQYKYGPTNASKLLYDRKGYVAIPDEWKHLYPDAIINKKTGAAFLKTDAYDGYGHFGENNKYDVYEMIVDWNRDYLKWTREEHPLHPLYVAICEGKSKEEIDAIAIQCGENQYWKRNIGISISCYNEDMDRLKYPIKIVTSTRVLYKDCKRSYSCQ